MVDALQCAATYADKIFKVATPAELPVEQPAKFGLIINLKTANALGLTIPQSLLSRADEVVQYTDAGRFTAQKRSLPYE